MPNQVREQRNTRGDQPMDTFSNDWAVFAQDDLKLTPRLTLFLGLRYEVIGVFVDKNDIYANFVPPTAAITSCRTTTSPHCCRLAPCDWAAPRRRTSSRSAAA